jgi:hypothetical protein
MSSLRVTLEDHGGAVLEGIVDEYRLKMAGLTSENGRKKVARIL